MDTTCNIDKDEKHDKFAFEIKTDDYLLCKAIEKATNEITDKAQTQQGRKELWKYVGRDDVLISFKGPHSLLGKEAT